MKEKGRYVDAVRVRLSREQVEWLKTIEAYKRGTGRSAIIRKALDMYRAQTERKGYA